jgi:NAD(P)-dependent dehydrogenase (short-subunit alcohol dehydrogenase family)
MQNFEKYVYVVDISFESAQKVATSLPSMATNQPNNDVFRCAFGVADVGNEDDIKRVIHDAWKLFGRAGVFFSNAGIMTIGGVDDDVSNCQMSSGKSIQCECDVSCVCCSSLISTVEAK